MLLGKEEERGEGGGRKAFYRFDPTSIFFYACFYKLRYRVSTDGLRVYSRVLGCCKKKVAAFRINLKVFMEIEFWQIDDGCIKVFFTTYKSKLWEVYFESEGVILLWCTSKEVDKYTNRLTTGNAHVFCQQFKNLIITFAIISNKDTFPRFHFRRVYQSDERTNKKIESHHHRFRGGFCYSEAIIGVLINCPPLDKWLPISGLLSLCPPANDAPSLPASI